MGGACIDGATLAGKSNSKRLELHPTEGVSRDHKIRPDSAAIERLFVELFLEAHAAAPEQIVLDLDATDDLLHGDQEGRFFHGYYDGYCHLPLYMFCSENRIKEARLDLFATRLSTATFRANQLRLWLACAAYVLMHSLRRIGLAGRRTVQEISGLDPSTPRCSADET